MPNDGAMVMKEFDLDEEIASCDLQPVGSRIIVKELEATKIGRIHLPNGSKELQTNEGYIVAIGPEVTWVSVGQRIYYGMYSGVWVFRPDKDGRPTVKFRMMNQEDILGKVKGYDNTK